jgi:N-methylhydantoinase A/oxoprolinase/acetone carboxylase beta subunit
VTDANVVLGRLPLDAPLGGRIHLDPAAARDAVGALARELGLSPEECADGILAVAVQEMARALRRVSVERGEDPRGAALIAFGGAGPLHACQVADELGVRRVVAPPAAGVLAALGLVVAGERRDYVQTVLARVDRGQGLAGLLAPLAERAGRELAGASLRAGADCRYVGQSHALTVDWDPEAPESALADAFHEAHRGRYGDAEPGRPVEAVSLRLAAERPGADPELPRAEPGAPVAGPAVIPMEGATCWVAPGWTARTDAIGSVVMERDEGA